MTYFNFNINIYYNSEEVKYNDSNKQIINKNKDNNVDMQNKPFDYNVSREINNQSIQMFDSILENSNEKSNIKKSSEIPKKKNRKAKGYSGVVSIYYFLFK